MFRAVAPLETRCEKEVGEPGRGGRICRLGREIALVVGEPWGRICRVSPRKWLRCVEAAGGPLIELRFIEAGGRIDVQIRARVIVGSIQLMEEMSLHIESAMVE